MCQVWLVFTALNWEKPPKKGKKSPSYCVAHTLTLCIWMCASTIRTRKSSQFLNAFSKFTCLAQSSPFTWFVQMHLGKREREKRSFYHPQVQCKISTGRINTRFMSHKNLPGPCLQYTQGFQDPTIACCSVNKWMCYIIQRTEQICYCDAATAGICFFKRYGLSWRKKKNWRGGGGSQAAWVLKRRCYQVFFSDPCWEGRTKISKQLMKTSAFQQDGAASRLL